MALGWYNVIVVVMEQPEPEAVMIYVPAGRFEKVPAGFCVPMFGEIEYVRFGTPPLFAKMYPLLFTQLGFNPIPSNFKSNPKVNTHVGLFTSCTLNVWAPKDKFCVLF